MRQWCTTLNVYRPPGHLEGGSRGGAGSKGARVGAGPLPCMRGSRASGEPFLGPQAALQQAPPRGSRCATPAHTHAHTHTTTHQPPGRPGHQGRKGVGWQRTGVGGARGLTWHTGRLAGSTRGGLSWRVWRRVLTRVELLRGWQPRPLFLRAPCPGRACLTPCASPPVCMDSLDAWILARRYDLPHPPTRHPPSPRSPHWSCQHRRRPGHQAPHWWTRRTTHV